MRIIAFVSCLFLSLMQSYSLGVESKVAAALAERIIPEYADRFIFQKISQSGSVDCFELESQGDKIIVRGSNANSMAVGLNHYLKYYCHTTVSWYANDRVCLSGDLPAIPKKIGVDARCENRFFLNYCTFGYTMPWWQWRDWERLIDWMALNGVTMPLAITGQEAIWYKVWQRLGLNEQEIRSYFTGPAHLPWHRMLNLDYWQGNLPHSWLEHQLQLQKQIVAREREFNMKPVLPAFAGHVPYELLRVYPDAKISKLSEWGGFGPQYRASFLDPMDPLFSKIQRAYMEEQQRQFGTDHIYGIDPFNEVNPPSWEPEYLQRVGKTIFETLTDVDKEAVWLQMTWLFYHKRKEWTPERIKAFVTSIPAERSLLLDYYGEHTEIWKRTESYYGVPYLWCFLGNFGGNTMLAGNLKRVDERIENAFRNGGKNLSGLGSTLEGFDCNPFLYEFLFEKAWNTGVNGADWINRLADRRTGRVDDNARKAWKLLVDSIYTSHAVCGHCPMTNARPQFGKQMRYAKTKITYDNRVLLEAWGLLLQAGNKKSGAYVYDVVNLARQTLGNYFGDLWKQYEKACQLKDKETMRRTQAAMMDILKETDELLSSESSFLLGKWIDDARTIGKNDEEKAYYEKNARNLITTWGGSDMELNDYANRTWAGLTSGFYTKRWTIFFEEVNRSIGQGKEFPVTAYHKKITNFEKEWWEHLEGTYETKPMGDGYALSKKLYDKYVNHILNLTKN